MICIIIIIIIIINNNNNIIIIVIIIIIIIIIGEFYVERLCWQFLSTVKSLLHVGFLPSVGHCVF